MDPLSRAEYVQAAAAVIAAARLFQRGSSSRQPALLSYLIFIAIDLSALAGTNPRSRTYFDIYYVFTVFSWFIGIFVVREMFALTFERYPGIRAAGRWALYVAMGLSTAVSILITIFFGKTHSSVWLYYIQVLNRSVVLCLAAIVIGILVFLSRFPLHLNPNTYVSTSFFSAAFLSEALIMEIDSFSRFLYSKQVDVTQVYFAAVCLVGWAILLRPEPAAAARRVVFDNPDESKLLQQLDSLNRVLSRAGRR